jgi:leucyl aminopeptidase
MIESKVADLSSTGDPGQAGAITAALFLQEFAKVSSRSKTYEIVRLRCRV